MGRYRPWLAAVLALLVAGLGHAYLRRWRRAFMWFGWIFGSGLVLTAVFADSASTQPAVLAPEILIPLLLLFLMSAIDAFRLGKADVGTQIGGADISSDAPESADAEPTCPHCGKGIDPDLDFCTWCTEPLPQNEDVDELV